MISIKVYIASKVKIIRNEEFQIEQQMLTSINIL